MPTVPKKTSSSSSTAATATTTTSTIQQSQPKQQDAAVGDLIDLSPAEEIIQEMEADENNSSDDSTNTGSTSTTSQGEAMATSPPQPSPRPSILKQTLSRQSVTPSQDTGGARRKVLIQGSSRSSTSHSSLSGKSSQPPRRRLPSYTLEDERRHQEIRQQFRLPQHRRKQGSQEDKPPPSYHKVHHSREHTRRRQSPSPDRHRSSSRWVRHIDDEEIHDRTRSLSRVRLEEEMATFEASREEFVALDLSSHVGRELIKSGDTARPDFKFDSFDERLRADRAALHEIAPDARDDNGNPSRPYLDEAPMMFRGHVVRRIRPSTVVNMRCAPTGQLIWIPLALMKDVHGHDTVFLRLFLKQKPNVKTAWAFMEAHDFVKLDGKRTTLGQCYNVPVSYQMGPIVQFLSNVQQGYDNFDHWKVGICPHRFCKSAILFIERGHFCKVLNNKWTPCFVAHDFIDEAREKLKRVHPWTRHSIDLPSMKDLREDH